MLPIIHTPVTKFCESVGGMQNGKCGEFYLDFMRCASRVSAQRAMNYDCVKELADYRECLFHEKQSKRVAIIMKERERQKRPYIEPLSEEILRRGHRDL